MVLFYIFLFLSSLLILWWAGARLVNSLMVMAKFLKWREFIVAFFIMAFATSLPNLIVGISSAIHKVPQLSFGDVMGANVADFTLAVALAAIISKGISTESVLVQSSALFTFGVAILPLLLIYDGVLGRGDGIVLVLTFLLYNIWVFSKKSRFTKTYNNESFSVPGGLKIFLRSIGAFIVGILFLLLAAEGIVRSSLYFAQTFNLSIPLVGMLIVGLGTSVPEIYFSIASALKSQAWMILGNLMGSVVTVTTLVLGIIAIIYPIHIDDFSPFAIARIFLIISAFFFFIITKSGKRITRKEGFFLLFIYILFVAVEILAK